MPHTRKRGCIAKRDVVSGRVYWVKPGEIFHSFECTFEKHLKKENPGTTLRTFSRYSEYYTEI
jgi:hypothetical protein